MSRRFVFKRLSTRDNHYDALQSRAGSEEQTVPFIGDHHEEKTKIGSQKDQDESPRRYLVSSSLLAALVTLSLLLGLALGVIPTSATKTQRAPKTLVRPCGGTPEEARTNGCHFDIISFCWLPDDCYDAELSDEFDHANHLEWFLDPNRTQPLSHEQIMTGEYTGLYVNWEYHIRHCTAMWKKFHRAIMKNLGTRAIDGYIGSYEHTKHCEHMLLGGRGVALDTINTRIAVKYPDCGIVPTGE